MPDDKGNSSDSGGIGTLLRIAPVILILLLLVKVYGVAWYTLETTTALVTAAPLSVLLGTLALYEYVFMAALTVTAVILFIMGIVGEGGLRPWMPYTFALAAFSALLTPLFYLPWAGLAIVIVLTIYLAPRAWGVWKVRRGNGRKTKVSPSLGRIAMMVGTAVVAITVLLTIDRPWLPAEVVELQHKVVVNPRKDTKSSRPVVFVVSEQNDWITMLVDYDRYLVRVPSTDVVKRTVCHLNWQLGNGQTLYQWLTGQPYYAAGLACWRLTDLHGQEPPPGMPSTGPHS